MEAVQIDRHLYAHGLLPCDINPENILICRSEGEASVTSLRGCLIDLDLDLDFGKRQIGTLPCLSSVPAFMEREFGEVAPILSTLLQFYYEKGMLMGQVDANVSSSALRAIARTAVSKAEFPEAQSKALTSTMRAYLQLLRIAYIFRGYEYHFIHDRVIELLRDLLEKLNDASYGEGRGEYTREVLKEREGSAKGLQ
ncbi:hypothetical protein GGF50DRAFT_119931 [Schizophyllum commune]